MRRCVDYIAVVGFLLNKWANNQMEFTLITYRRAKRHTNAHLNRDLLD